MMPRIKNEIEIILLSVWLNNNYSELKTICQKVSKQNEVDDLLHSCILQFSTNKKVNDIPDDSKLFFFTKIVRNNFYSKSSPYARQYTNYKFTEIYDLEVVEEEYSETIFNLEWVRNELKKMDWYFSRIFELYIEEGCSITKLSKRTTIPKNSLSRDIKKVRDQLNKSRQQQKDIY